MDFVYPADYRNSAGFIVDPGLDKPHDRDWGFSLASRNDLVAS